MTSHDKESDVREREYRERLQRALGDAYELRPLLGRGGFGSVYAAWDRRLERDVAVKALRHDLFPTPAVLARFQREARAVASLRHPNILPVYTVGEADGIAFMVMPLVEGESLRAVIEREGRLPVEQVVRFVMEIALALESAHRRGFVHRDVKPENILLDGENRHVLLMDFGVAKALTGEDTGLTDPGMVIGSASYMSPEQARGDADIDHRADLYALGIVAYELLSGAVPFAARNVHELVYRQATQSPAPLGAVAPEVPAPLSAVIMRCLATERDMRIQSARAVVEALAAAAPASGAIAGVPPGTGVGTSLALGVLVLVLISTGAQWLREVGQIVRGAGRLGEGFGFAVSLLLPFQVLALALIAVGVVLMAWNTTVLYRRHRRFGTALALSFPRPSRTVALFAGASILLLIVVTLVYVIPVLQSIVASVHAQLPLSMRMVIGMSVLIRTWWWLGGAALLFLYLRRRRQLAWRSH